MMWWAVWCAVVMVGAGTAAAPAQDSLSQLAPLDLVQIDPSAPDDESVSYAMPSSLGGRYAAGAAPWLYLLAEMPHDSQVAKRGIPSRARRGFSINPAVDVLQRGAVINLIERLAQNNRSYLNRVGKRSHRATGRRSLQAEDAVSFHRPAHVRAAGEAEPREGEEDTHAPGGA
ncbi:diuretic hormone 1 isoform X2 [Plodia interpunctella]|uniref:diuretic hormone 1 isoform X2 n=1 Tax=Plodia interpunctella TaxID=58824 RepID=UPI0023674ECC|nr:diuretic hormone 1 isoform X2 [Plodia interpunctella]